MSVGDDCSGGRGWEVAAEENGFCAGDFHQKCVSGFHCFFGVNVGAAAEMVVMKLHWMVQGVTANHR